MLALGDANPTIWIINEIRIFGIGTVATYPARAIYEATLMRMLAQIHSLIIPEPLTSIIRKTLMGNHIVHTITTFSE